MESRSTTRSRSEDHHRHGGQQQQLRQAWSYGVSFTGGVSWPPVLQRSSYTCGYCKREFRSAQALGGHMNVHRRERARLRQYYCGYPSMMIHRQQHENPPLSPHFTCGGSSMTTAAVATDPTVVYSFFSAAATAAATTTKDALMEVDLELGVGVFGSDGGLDLELRLGCS